VVARAQRMPREEHNRAIRKEVKKTINMTRAIIRVYIMYHNGRRLMTNNYHSFREPKVGVNS
jgi:hypothetical protein